MVSFRKKSIGAYRILSSLRPRRNRLDVAVSCLFFFFLLHEKKASSWTIADASCITHGFDCFPRQSQRLFDALTEVTRGRNIRFVGVVAARPHRTLKRLYIQTRSCDNPHPHPARIAHAAETPPADNGKEAEQETRRKRHPYINTYIYSDTPTSTTIYTYLHLSIGQANERGGGGGGGSGLEYFHPFRSSSPIPELYTRSFPRSRVARSLLSARLPTSTSASCPRRP